MYKKCQTKNLQEECWAGAIKALTDEENEYRRVSRGVYQKIPAAHNRDELDKVIKNAIMRIEQAMIIDIRKLTQEEFKNKKKKAEKMISMLNALLK